jgi:hypothetical protein
MSSDDPLLASDPADGYRVVPQELGAAVAWLEIQLLSGGETVPGFQEGALSVELTSWSNPDAPQFGERSRLQFVLEAVCRYLNTGGDWEDLKRVLMVMMAVAPGGRHLGGYYYLGGELNSEGVFEHLFAKGDGSGAAVRWVENQFVEPVDLSKLDFELDDEGEEEAEGYEGSGPPEGWTQLEGGLPPP